MKQPPFHNQSIVLCISETMSRECVSEFNESMSFHDNNATAFLYSMQKRLWYLGPLRD